MYRVKLFNTPETARVLEEKNCIRLYALETITIQPTEMKVVVFGDFRYEFENAVGIPYISKKDVMNGLTLYHSKGSFKWHDSDIAKVALWNPTSSPITLHAGDFIASIKLMSIQFYELWKRSNNSDRGLASVPIKIELT